MSDQEQIVCTHCGAPMVSRSCKLRCLACGYFEDCSDTGLPVFYAEPEPDVRTLPLGRNQLAGRTSK
jgi:ssDNA-binding Zn-finger/Zn-ribbon topoisomerase 1